MEGRELLADGLERVQAMLHYVVDGLTVEQLLYQPQEGCNSIAWLAWHLTRVQDHHLSDLAGLPQAWVSEGWHAVFDMAPDPTNTGGGHTPAEVAAFRTPDGAALLRYHDAVYKRSLAYLETLAPADMDVEINEPQYQPLPTVGVRLVSVVNDNTEHAGQAAYLRGMFQGAGWLGV